MGRVASGLQTGRRRDLGWFWVTAGGSRVGGFRAGGAQVAVDFNLGERFWASRQAKFLPQLPPEYFVPALHHKSFRAGRSHPHTDFVLFRERLSRPNIRTLLTSLVILLVALRVQVEPAPGSGDAHPEVLRIPVPRL